MLLLKSILMSCRVSSPDLVFCFAQAHAAVVELFLEQLIIGQALVHIHGIAEVHFQERAHLLKTDTPGVGTGIPAVVKAVQCFDVAFDVGFQHIVGRGPVIIDFVYDGIVERYSFLLLLFKQLSLFQYLFVGIGYGSEGIGNTIKKQPAQKARYGYEQQEQVPEIFSSFFRGEVNRFLHGYRIVV